MKYLRKNKNILIILHTINLSKFITIRLSSVDVHLIYQKITAVVLLYS